MHSVIIKTNSAFPPLLRHIPDAPLRLHVLGELNTEDHICIGIVGTRKPSRYGLQTAKYFAQAMARAGMVVVSGLALGIDAAAHEGAIDGGGKTIAVLGSGIDLITPTQHEGLAREIIKRGGAVITEYPPGTPPLKHHFLARNRIIAGMCHALLVIEAPERSGALVTARQALEYNREVFCIPGNITSESSIGTNHLIQKSGAMLVTKPEDIFDALELSYSSPEANSDSAKMSHLHPSAEKIFSLTTFDPVLIDEIIIYSKLPTSEVMAQISMLELAGIVARMGSYVVRTR